MSHESASPDKRRQRRSTCWWSLHPWPVVVCGPVGVARYCRKKMTKSLGGPESPRERGPGYGWSARPRPPGKTPAGEVFLRREKRTAQRMRISIATVRARWGHATRATCCTMRCVTRISSRLATLRFETPEHANATPATAHRYPPISQYRQAPMRQPAKGASTKVPSSYTLRPRSSALQIVGASLGCCLKRRPGR